MTIKRAADNKIIRSVSGEVLKTPPIIDISSDYGVTKDGSNLVSAVRNRYQPNQFLAHSGFEPIENGDGFEFDGDPYLIGEHFDYNNEFQMEFWINCDLSTNYRIIEQRNLLYESPKNFLSIMSYISGVADPNRSFNTVIYSDDIQVGNHRAYNRNVITPGVWEHFYINRTKDVITSFMNGKMGQCRSDLVQTYTIDNRIKLTIGRLLNYQEQFSGSIRNFKIDYSSSNFIGWNGTSLNYEEEEQVFTPPTYPLTIL